MRQLSTILVLTQVAAQYYDVSDSNPIVPMADYSKDFRTLDCLQCFQAEGKMCHEKNYNSMIAVTGSSNSAHGICCKPGSTNEHCVNGGSGDHMCSEPVKTTEEKYKDILTSSSNFQMFAYCPGIN